ncbi:tRNA (adenosine(37)-N6)-threonylcarbamoyltransferase complex dimerization subunit type 1 TsaB [Pukyongiella litopenaei]|uniref:tRNA (Adenosine(37)-N6)-threonylcarbamoyltransferase complex dimerization subunit type 1 TsaB n=1 Tax=Pukyongiella litopenaei TaxID=2605946 RepID=A0A2S0MR07_9RHOB|nr:tRNA (adenosine(37)-N6)-threonylcarbamoyltransferase complex dimerization subunit type 1 TsaB [Pukyongiella litopenaei]AVO38320.1 tRNA (adenosine(37)-N6)-threonylcarbamoyltransferase complex dimerization subunit type 1 TsaB [Pukyongiella litopenaei]
MTAPLILGFDCSAAHCAAALLSGDRVLADRLEPMKRGQAERLMPLLEEVLAETGTGWRDLSALGVGVGPGNFTGIRIAVSAARGLALGLGVPAVGVTGFEARALLAPGACVAVPGMRDQVWLDGAPPRLVPEHEARAEAAAAGCALCADASPAGLAGAIARIAATRHGPETEPPAPLYARPADAAPSREAPPVLLD